MTRTTTNLGLAHGVRAFWFPYAQADRPADAVADPAAHPAHAPADAAPDNAADAAAHGAPDPATHMPDMYV